MTDAAPPAPERPRRRRALRIVLALLAVLLVVVGAALWQIHRLTSNLAVAEPLVIQKRAVDEATKKQLAERLERQVRETGGAVRLSGADVTLILQEALADRSLLGTLRRERRRAVEGLKRVPDPLGIWGDLRLEDVVLKKLAADVALADGRATVRLTAPYRDGERYLNVVARLGGHWRRGDVAFDLHGLRVGQVDVMEMAGFGAAVERVVEDAVRERAAAFSQRAIREARLEGDALVLVMDERGR